MKMKYVYIVLLTLLSSLHLQGQKKNVDAAWRLVGKTESVAEARTLIKEAMGNPQTASQARTYYVAGMIEWRSYEADVRKREINPQDKSVTDDGMAAKLLDGYRYFMRALPLDSVPDKKGKIKPKYSKDILEILDMHGVDLYRAGALSYIGKKYYPQAYEGFMNAAELILNPAMVNTRRHLSDSVCGTAYFFAGLSAYGAKQPFPALKAFGKAEQNGVRTDTLYLYEMAIWEQLARDSIHLRNVAQDSLLAISARAYRLHGITNPAFLSRMTQIYIADQQTDSILVVLNKEIEKSPEAWLPRGLRGWVYESRGDINSAIIDYRLAAEHPDMSAKMLMRAAHTLYRTAHAMKNDIRGTRKQRQEMTRNLIENYLTPAESMASRAKEKTSDNKDLELIHNILEAIDYDLSVLR